MATRKKSQQAEPGLLGGPSRKQYDSFTPRTGEYIKPEKHANKSTSVVLAGGALTFSLITVPEGYQARILYFMFRSRGGGTSNLRYADADSYSGITYLLSNDATGVYLCSFSYENAPIVQSGSTVDVSQGVGCVGSLVTVTYSLELKGEGYFTN